VFIFDYYDSINIFDFNNLIKNIFNYLLDGADITQSSSPKEIEDKTKFMLLIERLCGKCFDNSDEINVSVISKIDELDDDSDDFFTFSEIVLGMFKIFYEQNIVTRRIFLKWKNLRIPNDRDELYNTVENFLNEIE
jgi:hypothetical protein